MDQQVLYLRTESLEEKQLWYAAFKQAQRALVNCTASRHLSLAPSSSSSTTRGGDRARGKAMPPTGAAAGGVGGRQKSATTAAIPARALDQEGREKREGGKGEKSPKNLQRAAPEVTGGTTEGSSTTTTTTTAATR